MKITYINTIALFGVLFILCPVVVYIVDPAIFAKRFTEILQCISSVTCGLVILNIFFGLRETFIATDTVKFYTLPIIALILFGEAFGLFVANSAFFDAHWQEISVYGGSLITGGIVAILFLGLNHHLFVRIDTTVENPKTTAKTEKDNKKVPAA